MTRATRLFHCASGTAAAEMALVLPLLLALICSCVELGNYFMDEHRLIKAVRDGARFAARQDVSNFTGCSGNVTGQVLTDTQNVVMTGVLSGGDVSMPNISTSNVTVSIVGCSTTAGGQNMLGIYSGIKNGSGTVVGAPIVNVSASVPYAPAMRAFGWNGSGLTLNASQQAAVMGW